MDDTAQRKGPEYGILRIKISNIFLNFIMNIFLVDEPEGAFSPSVVDHFYMLIPLLRIVLVIQSLLLSFYYFH